MSFQNEEAFEKTYTGQVVRLRQGDVVVQRGTMHNWVNPGTQPCRIAFVLLSAKKLEFQGVNLEEEG